MKELLEKVINRGNFKLETMKDKIDTYYIEDAITKEEKDYLLDLAIQNADKSKSYSKTLEERVASLEVKVKALEENKVEEPSEPSDEPIEEVIEFPPFKQPEGSHDCYNIGMGVTASNGKKVISKIDGNVYDPVVFPQFWDEVVE